MKRLFSVLLTVCMLLSIIACGQKNTAISPDIDPAIAALSDDEYFSQVFTPAFRFLVCSDIHVDDYGTKVEEDRIGQMMDAAYSYVDEQADGIPLSTVMVAGDIADNGTLRAMQKCIRLLKDSMREETELWISMGNHDFYAEGENSPAIFCYATGYDSEDNHVVIGGYHFILVSPDKDGKGYSKDKQKFLSDALQDAAADDPTGRKPIFVIQHHHVSDTVYGSDRWGTEDLRKTLNKYPQVVDFSGHSHFPIDDPTSIWQGEFTALGTGTLSYSEVGIAGLYPDSVWPIGTDGAYTTVAPWESGGVKAKDLAQFYIVEVDQNQAIRILGYDLLSGSFFMDPLLLRSVGEPQVFRYTEDRAATSEAPYFDADATLTEESRTAQAITFRFPQAHSKDTVQNYRCEVYLGEELVQTEYRLACTFYTPAPESLTVPVTLSGSGHYTVKVFGVNSFAVSGEPLTVEFDA